MQLCRSAGTFRARRARPAFLPVLEEADTAEEAGERTGRAVGGIMMIWGIGLTRTEDPGSRIAGFLFLDTITCPVLDEILNLRN